MGPRSSKHDRLLRRPTLDQSSVTKLKQELNDEFSDEEINTWFDMYNTSRKRGHRELTRDEFRQVYSTMFPGDASEFSEHVFRSFDTDHNGTVDFHEFLMGLCMSGTHNFDIKLRWAFQMYDIDGNGYITRPEMNRMLMAVCKMTGDSFLDDLEKDVLIGLVRISGRDISGLRLKKQPPPDGLEKRIQNITNDIFSMLDTNEDGKISKKEFQEGVSKLPVIVNLLGSE